MPASLSLPVAEKNYFNSLPAAEKPRLLVVRTDSTGDFSNYRLSDYDNGYNFDMMLTDLSEDEINRAKAGHPFTYEQSIYGEFYTFKSPDGGTFVIAD